ncbi:3-deoxy-8-phosphooctulonate synthase [Thermodesulfatator autotrophicus]|uniref:2-dehydro-3-deoxyphosphooctonate aldolase n=1 Tax=Thermodesulfatator autotrophicus TaxID=1795632 RepID=A0A177E573_9BACT|nr:2-dehydro-3-deoxyphosphooctonate aldolase [Thermodesulfatator autotrophicus]
MPKINSVKIANFQVGGAKPLLIAGPCVLEEIDIALKCARFMKEVAREAGFNYVFKASFDKANRTSLSSYRGPGIEKGLAMLEQVKKEMNVPVISDIHEPWQAEPAAEVLDIIQIPAFLCRQTDLIVAAARTGRPVNIKKGQFVSPWDMYYAVEKARGAGAQGILLTERGYTFGYRNLVVDMRTFPIMRSFGVPVIFDATHSVQLPGGAGGASGGEREFVGPLARAAIATGVDGIFMEVHPEPEKALCDGPNSLPLEEARKLLLVLKEIYEVILKNDILSA